MATASTLQFDVKQIPIVAVRGRDTAAAAKVSQLMQENHEAYHIFFNASGFHNHIAHHLPSIYAIGANPKQLQKQYDQNKNYQLKQQAIREKVVQDLRDDKSFSDYLGKGKYYHDFLVYYQDEIAKKGWQNVINEVCLSGSKRADDMLARLYDGALHPIIHLGYGVEFEQPALVAEALAETAVHDSNIANQLFYPAEKAAKRLNSGDSPSLAQLLAEVRNNKKLVGAVTPDLDLKMRDGVFAAAGEEMVQIAQRFTVEPTEDDIQKKLRQMIEVCAYFTFASQRPKKAVKMDFFYMHSMNCSLFFTRFMSSQWISLENRARLLEWKGRYDLAMYVSRACPELNIEEIRSYAPKMLRGSKQEIPEEEQWNYLFAEACERPDDGHVSKLLRACRNGDQLWKSRANSGEIITSNADWLKMAHMTLDSTESGITWVRTTGHDEAWRDVPARDPAANVRAAL